MSSSQTEFVEQSDCNSECNIDDTLAQTPPKKKVKPDKRYCVFRSKWLKEQGMSWVSKVDNFTANALSTDSPFLLNMTVNPQLLAMLN